MSHIVLIGPGAIGCAVGAALLQAGHRVTFCARQSFGRLSVRKDDEPPLLFPAEVAMAPDTVPAADWVVLSVKTYQVEGAAGWLKPAMRPGTRLAVIQNGVEHRENVAPFVPADTPIVPVVIDLPVKRLAPGEAVWSRVAVAAVPDDAAGLAFAGLFAGSFLQVEATPDLITRAWTKLCNNAPSGAVLALSAQPMGVFHQPGVADVARAILRECLAVGRAEGAQLDEALIEKQMLAFLAARPDEGNSIYADRMAGRPMEWDARNGVIVRKAAEHGIAVPVSAALVPLLAAISNSAKA